MKVDSPVVLAAPLSLLHAYPRTACAFRSTTIRSITQNLSEIYILLHMTECRGQTEYLLLPRDTFYSAAVLRSHHLTAPQMFHTDDGNFLYRHSQITASLFNVTTAAVNHVIPGNPSKPQQREKVGGGMPSRRRAT
jgi:hypothetical protein